MSLSFWIDSTSKQSNLSQILNVWNTINTNEISTHMLAFFKVSVNGAYRYPSSKVLWDYSVSPQSLSAGLLQWSRKPKEIDTRLIVQESRKQETIFQQMIEGGRGNPKFDAHDFWWQVKPNQQTPQTPERIPSDSQRMISVRSVG